MKRVISVSLGSARRDHTARVEVLGETFEIERRGTDGDMNKAEALIRELDGKVDAFGLGGTDLYVYAGQRRYIFRDAARLARAAQQSPLVDGSGLKNTLERQVVAYLQQQEGMEFQGKQVMVVSAMDRFGLAEAMHQAGAQCVFGDLMFALGIPIPLRSLAMVSGIARVAMPVVARLPFKWIYPTGSKQETIEPRYQRYYQQAEVIGGDFHFIRRHLPDSLPGKVIITNTVTAEDVAELKKRGVAVLVTTTPELQGRSFGTNVMEAMLVALAGGRQLQTADYQELIERVGFKPRVERLA